MISRLVSTFPNSYYYFFRINSVVRAFLVEEAKIVKKVIKQQTKPGKK